MEVTQLLEGCKGKNIVILGDIMLDRYLYGEVSRISPEAPVPVMDLQTVDNRLGGAANVAVNLLALETVPLLCGMAGSDDEANMLLHEMEVQGLSAEGLIRSFDRRTTLKTRVIAQGQHLLRVDREDRFALTEEERSRVSNYLEKVLREKKVHAFVFQDYNKGLLDADLIRHTIRSCKDRGIPTLVDPKKEHLEAYKGVTLFKPNLKEVNELLGFRVEPELDSLNKAAAALRKVIDQEFTMITLGKYGIYVDNNGEGVIQPTIPRNIVDVCGAGDTVLSVAAAGLASGWEIGAIARLANLAGGQVCEKVGVVPVEKTKLIDDFLKNKG